MKWPKKKMLRFYFVIITSIIFIIYYIVKLRIMSANKKLFTIESRYRTVRHLAIHCMINSNIRTLVYGVDKLPKEGGYVMYPNHQGRYDIVGIFYAHKKPCTLVMEAERSKIPIATEVIEALDGVRLDKRNMRSQVSAIARIVKEVSDGRRYVIFPEGGYDNNKNELQEFKHGAFKVPLKTKCPIVPVVLIDSYKPYTINTIRRVKTQVHFLDPINYDEYKDLTTHELSDLVKSRIKNKMDEILK